MDNKEEKDEETDVEDNFEEYQRRSIEHFRDYLIAAFIGIPEMELSNSPIFNMNLSDDLLLNTSEMIEENQIMNETNEIRERSEKIRLASEMDKEDCQPSKKPNINTKPKLVRKKITLYKSLQLKSGNKYIFTEDDGKEILLTAEIEPNLFIRKLVSKIPETIKYRLEFLSNFINEEMNEVMYVDQIETNEYIDSSKQFNPKQLFTNLKEQLYTAYLKEVRLRRAFRNLLQRWRIRRIDRKAEEVGEEIDPITLMVPEKEVYLYDLEVGKRYTFDAKSLSSWIETKLLYSEGGFPMPMYPKNPWTNIDFTYYQLISIYNQLKEKGELKWGLVTFRKYNFNKHIWARYHNSALTLTAIRTSLRNLDSYDSREILEDFINLKMEELHIFSPNYVTNAYRQAILKVPNHWYLEEFKAVAFMHLESDHFNWNNDRIINDRCKKIFRKQEQFIDELIKANIIAPRNARPTSSSSSSAASSHH
jgi:hypothetical protein